MVVKCCGFSTGSQLLSRPHLTSDRLFPGGRIDWQSSVLRPQQYMSGKGTEFPQGKSKKWKPSLRPKWLMPTIKEQPSMIDRMKVTQLMLDVPPEKAPLVYTGLYDISFLGMEKLHPFDSGKWGRVSSRLVSSGVVSKEQLVEPEEASEDDLLVVHTKAYLKSLKHSSVVARITELGFLALIPNAVLQRVLLRPFRFHVGGSVLATKLAHERGWAVNIGGGFHHACATQGGGFCVYADISLAVHTALSVLKMSRVQIIDLDAHQGNGHERDWGDDERVYILDMYNASIYPQDLDAKKGISLDVPLQSGIESEDYLTHLRNSLEVAAKEVKPDMVVYNAGTDVLEGDLLGRMKVSPHAVVERDEIVFSYARSRNIPIVMMTSGGYQRNNAQVIADSICNLYAKNIVSNASS